MKIINAGYEILTPVDGDEILRKLERIARVCYKSEDKISCDSAERLISNLIALGHDAMLEHHSITVKFIVDRGVSHELVRHRIASFAQESTRYCNYGQGQFGREITVIRPCFLTEGRKHFSDGEFTAYGAWHSACEFSEKYYIRLLELGRTPQEARSVLPNSLKTEVIMTANLREWRHFFKLRCDHTAHPQMREVTIPLLHELNSAIAVIFEDLKFE